SATAAAIGTLASFGRTPPMRRRSGLAGPDRGERQRGKFLEQRRERTPGGVEHGPALLGRGRGGVTGGALGVVVLHVPAQLGAAAIAEDGAGGGAVARGGVELLRRAHVDAG